MTYLIILLSLIIGSVIYLKLAEKYNIIDKPNQRSSHTIPTIRGGGVLFYFAILLYYIFNDFQYSYFIIGVSVIAIISFIDDLYTLSSTLRLPFQALSVYFILLQVNITVDPLWLLLGSIILGVTFINIYNFMDGINGITGLYSIVTLIGLFLINNEIKLIDNDLIIYVLLSIIVFGFYNFRKKARFFAGDVGSISVAMLLFFISYWMLIETKSILIIALFTVYGVDTLLTLLYRIIINEKITDAHRHHIYQKLVDKLNISHLKISIIYAILQLIINFVVYKTYNLEAEKQYLILAAVVSFFIVVYIFLFHKLKSIKAEVK